MCVVIMSCCKQCLVNKYDTFLPKFTRVLVKFSIIKRQLVLTNLIQDAATINNYTNYCHTVANSK